MQLMYAILVTMVRENSRLSVGPRGQPRVLRLFLMKKHTHRLDVK